MPEIEFPDCLHEPEEVFERGCWPVVYDPELPHASAHVCHREDCRDQVAAWVYDRTGHEAVFVPLERKS